MNLRMTYQFWLIVAFSLPLTAHARPDAPGPSERFLIVADALPVTTRATLREELIRFVTEGRQGDVTHVVAAPAHTPIATFRATTPPGRDRLRNPATRAAAAKLLAFLDDDGAAVPDGYRQQAQVPRLLDTFWGLRETDLPVRIVVVATPVHHDPDEPKWSFRDGRYPSPSALTDPTSTLPFRAGGRRKLPGDAQVTWLTPEATWSHKAHEDQVIRSTPQERLMTTPQTTRASALLAAFAIAGCVPRTSPSDPTGYQPSRDRYAVAAANATPSPTPVATATAPSGGGEGLAVDEPPQPPGVEVVADSGPIEPRGDDSVPRRTVPGGRRAPRSRARRELDQLILEYRLARDEFARTESSYEVDRIMAMVKGAEMLLHSTPLAFNALPERDRFAFRDYQQAADRLKVALGDHLEETETADEPDRAELVALMSEVDRVVAMRPPGTGNRMFDLLRLPPHGRGPRGSAR